MKRVLQAVMFLVLIAMTGTAPAIEPIPATPGWSGFVIAGGTMIDAKTNMVSGISAYHVDIGKKTVNSLADEPESLTRGAPQLNLNLNYTFSTQTQLFLGNSVENVVELDRASTLGVRQQFADKSILELSLVTTPYGSPLTVWEDPYVVGVPRQETDRTSRGARIEYDRILGSGFGVQYTTRKVDVENELSGTTPGSAGGQGLSAAQAELLKRDGNINRLSVSYRFPPAGRSQFQLRVGRLKDDLDGAAMSGDQNEIQLTHAYLGERFVTASNVFYWKEDYDAVNPVFNQTREDKTLGLAFFLFDTKIFSSKHWWGSFQAIWVNQNSNINFYDASSLIVSLGAMYRF